jgi:hypothetical protein
MSNSNVKMTKGQNGGSARQPMGEGSHMGVLVMGKQKKSIDEKTRVSFVRTTIPTDFSMKLVPAFLSECIIIFSCEN